MDIGSKKFCWHFLQGGALFCGMGDDQDQNHHEERLKEVFESFDASGCGSLTPEELADLCRSLQLEDATPALLHALLQNQDCLTARVDFQQFKNALIQVLYAAFPGAQEEQEAPPPTVSPEIQPKFVKGGKRYGRRSTPEFPEPASGVPDIPDTNSADEALEDNDDSAVPRKRERWNSQASSSEEFEAEGQMHLWNPDGPSTPRGSVALLSIQLEAELRHACEELEMAWEGCAARSELLVLCERLGLELGADAFLDPDEQMDVQEFVSRLVSRQKPPTPSASTPYRQLKRNHSTQSFDESGRRIPAFCSITATPLFTWLDDGGGHAAAESILDAWMDEGVENGVEILQALNLELDGKLNLSDLTAALENELLVTKNGVLQAALASFKAEIRHLLENVDQEIREKEKIRSDLEKAEKQKTQLASEVDEHHSAIERVNSLTLRRLEQEHRDKLGAVRSELMKEVEQIQQQASLQREEAEAEITKIREDEALLRDQLSISLKENRRLETELLDGAEKLEEAQSQILKLQRSLENLTKEKFGELDPGSADFLLQEERIKQLRSSYEAQCRELQDRIDELQSELQDFHSLSKGHAPHHKALSEELESKSPGMESDPGIGSEEVQPFRMSLEAEMMLERLKEQHLQQTEDLQNQLEIKVNEFNRRLEKQQEIHDEQEASLSLRYDQELAALREEMLSALSHAQELRNQLQQAERERTSMTLKPAAGGEELQSREAEVEQLRQQLLEALQVSADLEMQLKTLDVQRTEEKEVLLSKMEELKKQHAVEISKLKGEQEELLKARKELQEETLDLEKRLSAEWEQEREALEESHENQVRVTLEEVKVKFEEEKGELVRRLTEQWEEEKAQLDQQRNETLQVLLEEEMLRLVRDQEEKENSMREQWERECAQLQEHHEEVLHRRILEERLQLQEQSEQKEKKLREEWKEEKLQLEEDYEGMIQVQLSREKEQLEEEKEKMQKEAAEERERLEERHREAVKELSRKHAEERSALSSELQKLRDDIALERSEAAHLAQENQALRKKISALKEGELSQEELLQTLERLKKEKSAAQKAAETFKRQSRQLEDENGFLTEKNVQSAAHLERLQERREGFPAVAACVSALEAELTKALEDTAQLEDRNLQLSQQLCELREKAARMDVIESQLSQILAERQNADKEVVVLQNQLTKAQEKVKTVEENLQAVTRQNARLKADLKGSQQEKETLKRELAVLHKKLHQVQEKNHTLEAALHSSGLQSHSKKKCREEASRLKEQEQHLLRQENQRLQADVHGLRNDLVQSREKIHQLDATVLALSKHKPASQSSALKALEQENAALKQELQVKREQGGDAARSSMELENLQQENEALKAQMARLSSQLLESFQAQLAGLLPPSPHRVQRGHRGEDPENAQDEKKMRAMEERMKEIELSLHNVKLLLKEKVAQLKDQLHKNGKADVLIKDLYVENAQLMKALEINEQRQKIAEKKNYLLEEKISSLNKIVRDLNSLPLPAPPYSYK